MNNYHRQMVESMFRFRNIHFDKAFPEDVTAAEGRIMMKLNQLEGAAESGPVTMSALSRELNVSVQALSRTLKRMEEAGIVAKYTEEKDRRTHFVALTESGHEKLAEMDRIMMAVSGSVYRRIGEERIQEFLQFMDELYAITFEEIEKRKGEKT